jgi:hypothetical protein
MKNAIKTVVLTLAVAASAAASVCQADTTLAVPTSGACVDSFFPKICHALADHNDEVRANNAASASYQAAHEMDAEGSATKPWRGVVVGWNDNNQS